MRRLLPHYTKETIKKRFALTYDVMQNLTGSKQAGVYFFQSSYWLCLCSGQFTFCRGVYKIYLAGNTEAAKNDCAIAAAIVK